MNNNLFKLFGICTVALLSSSSFCMRPKDLKQEEMQSTLRRRCNHAAKAVGSAAAGTAIVGGAVAGVAKVVSSEAFALATGGTLCRWVISSCADAGRHASSDGVVLCQVFGCFQAAAAVPCCGACCTYGTIMAATLVARPLFRNAKQHLSAALACKKQQ